MIPTPLNLPRYIKRFFAEYLPTHRNCSPHTISAYSQAFRLFLGYLREQRQIAPSALMVLLASLTRGIV